MGIVSYRKRKRNKLTDEQADAVRAAEGLQVDIAVRFGITQAQVSFIKNGKRRKVK
jgi:hypothetical protein